MNIKSWKLRSFATRPSALKWFATFGLLCLVAAGAFAFYERWLPRVKHLLANSSAETESAQSGDSHHGHDHGDHHGHDHGDVRHDDGNSLELSPQAKKNVGLATEVVKLQVFEKTISMPALVVERPGRSQTEVTAPLGGRVSRVYPIQGEAVMPGRPLFELRMTHEELVNAQSELLRSSEELKVVKREIERLNSVSIPGAIPGRTLREREYEQQKLEAVIKAQRQSLVLHGLTDEQVANIPKTGKLLQGITVTTPQFPPNGHEHADDHPFHIQQLMVKPGQYVDAGDSLCLLADHHELFIEGRAFEQDIDQLQRAAKEGWAISAAPVSGDHASGRIRGLKIFYLSDSVDTESRAFHFYLRLPNRIVRDVSDEAGHRFVSWQFKPGQRMQVFVPVERWENRIVLPVDAVAQEGVETFVFEQKGDHFDRLPVHVEYRDKDWVVVENDRRLVGSTVATAGAQQLQMALRNKASGTPDPHAGHNH